MPTLVRVHEDGTEEEVPTQHPTMSDTTDNSPITPYQLSVPGSQDSTGTNEDNVPLAALVRHSNTTPTGGPSPQSDSGISPRTARDTLQVASAARSTASGDAAAIRCYNEYAVTEEKSLFQNITEEDVEGDNLTEVLASFGYWLANTPIPSPCWKSQVVVSIVCLANMMTTYEAMTLTTTSTSFPSTD